MEGGEKGEGTAMEKRDRGQVGRSSRTREEGKNGWRGRGDPEEMGGKETGGGAASWLLFSLLRQDEKQLREGNVPCGSQFEGYNLSW